MSKDLDSGLIEGVQITSGKGRPSKLHHELHNLDLDLDLDLDGDCGSWCILKTQCSSTRCWLLYIELVEVEVDVGVDVSVDVSVGVDVSDSRSFVVR